MLTRIESIPGGALYTGHWPLLLCRGVRRASTIIHDDNPANDDHDDQQASRYDDGPGKRNSDPNACPTWHGQQL